MAFSCSQLLYLYFFVLFINMIIANNLLPEVICCLQICNVSGSEIIVGDTYVPSVIVIGTAINQLETMYH